MLLGFGSDKKPSAAKNDLSERKEKVTFLEDSEHKTYPFQRMSIKLMALVSIHCPFTVIKIQLLGSIYHAKSQSLHPQSNAILSL